MPRIPSFRFPIAGFALVALLLPSAFAGPLSPFPGPAEQAFLDILDAGEDEGLWNATHAQALRDEWDRRLDEGYWMDIPELATPDNVTNDFTMFWDDTGDEWDIFEGPRTQLVTADDPLTLPDERSTDLRGDPYDSSRLTVAEEGSLRFMHPGFTDGFIDVVFLYPTPPVPDVELDGRTVYVPGVTVSGPGVDLSQIPALLDAGLLISCTDIGPIIMGNSPTLALRGLVPPNFDFFQPATKGYGVGAFAHC